MSAKLNRKTETKMTVKENCHFSYPSTCEGYVLLCRFTKSFFLKMV
jgi:hypothetical protein